MAPKDGLEQPTTGEEEPVEEDVEPFDEKPFAEADEVGRTLITVSNSDESEEFVTSRYYLSIVAYSLKKFRIFFNSSPPSPRS